MIKNKEYLWVYKWIKGILDLAQLIKNLKLFYTCRSHILSSNLSTVSTCLSLKHKIVLKCLENVLLGWMQKWGEAGQVCPPINVLSIWCWSSFPRAVGDQWYTGGKWTLSYVDSAVQSAFGCASRRPWSFHLILVSIYCRSTKIVDFFFWPPTKPKFTFHHPFNFWGKYLVV